MRVSFTGELGYEINVPSHFGRAVWEAAWREVEKRGGCAYGTEAMHVMRAEKGFVIVGQETDGTVTLADLGLDWAIGKSKKDFVGKRSLTRPDMLAANRKQLVGLLTDDPAIVLEEGAQVTESATPADRLVRARPCHLVLSQRDFGPLDRARAGRRGALAHRAPGSMCRCRAARFRRRSRRRSSTTSRERASMADATLSLALAARRRCPSRGTAIHACRKRRRRRGSSCAAARARASPAGLPSAPSRRRRSGRRAKAPGARRSGSARTNGS